jgi:hypothetical protein
MKKDNIINGFKDSLIELRQICQNAVDEKLKILEDSEGKIQELVTTAQQMEFIKKTREDLRKIDKETEKKIFESKKDLINIENKFKENK